MSHYLIDLFSPVLASSEILSVNDNPNGESPLQGNFVVRVPNGVRVQDPTNLGDLLTKKYAGLLTSYAGFTQIAYDDLLDTTGLDLTATGTDGMFGYRGAIKLNPHGIVQSMIVTLAGAAPAQAVVTWETYEVTLSDIESGPITRTYVERPSDPSYVTCEVTFDNGATWFSVLDGVVFNIAPALQGTSFKIRLRNTTMTPLHIGSWALCY